MANVYEFVPVSRRYVELLLYIPICINYVPRNFMGNFDVFFEICKLHACYSFHYGMRVGGTPCFIFERFRVQCEAVRPTINTCFYFLQ